tara:strand:- start:581 stop:727 length:147 start_codon:yes stop_codon:yes gene_type:complete
MTEIKNRALRGAVFYARRCLALQDIYDQKKHCGLSLKSREDFPPSEEW